MSLGRKLYESFEDWKTNGAEVRIFQNDCDRTRMKMKATVTSFDTRIWGKEILKRKKCFQLSQGDAYKLLPWRAMTRDTPSVPVITRTTRITPTSGCWFVCAQFPSKILGRKRFGFVLKRTQSSLSSFSVVNSWAVNGRPSSWSKIKIWMALIVIKEAYRSKNHEELMMCCG